MIKDGKKGEGERFVDWTSERRKRAGSIKKMTFEK